MESAPILAAQQALVASVSTPEAVRALESVLMAGPTINLTTEHMVFGGVSARSIFIPAGTVLTGTLTKRDNVCVVFGDITVTSDDGVQRLTGFNVLPARAGAKRAGVAHSDTWWVTLHRTDGTTVAEAEDEMTDELLGTRRMALEVTQ